jgi:hypothetical protein
MPITSSLSIQNDDPQLNPIEFDDIYSLLHTFHPIYAIPTLISTITTLLSREYPHISPPSSSKLQPHIVHNKYHYSRLPPGQTNSERRLINFLGVNLGPVVTYNEYYLPLIAIFSKCVELLALVRILRRDDQLTADLFQNEIKKCQILNKFVQNTGNTSTTPTLNDYHHYKNYSSGNDHQEALSMFISVLLDIISNPSDSILNLIGGKFPYSSQLSLLFNLPKHFIGLGDGNKLKLNVGKQKVLYNISTGFENDPNGEILEFQLGVLTDLVYDAVQCGGREGRDFLFCMFGIDFLEKNNKIGEKKTNLISNVINISQLLTQFPSLTCHLLTPRSMISHLSLNEVNIDKVSHYFDSFLFKLFTFFHPPNTSKHPTQKLTDSATKDNQLSSYDVPFQLLLRANCRLPLFLPLCIDRFDLLLVIIDKITTLYDMLRMVKPTINHLTLFQTILYEVDLFCFFFAIFLQTCQQVSYPAISSSAQQTSKLFIILSSLYSLAYSFSGHTDATTRKISHHIYTSVLTSKIPHINLSSVKTNSTSPFSCLFQVFPSLFDCNLKSLSNPIHTLSCQPSLTFDWLNDIESIFGFIIMLIGENMMFMVERLLNWLDLTLLDLCFLSDLIQSPHSIPLVLELYHQYDFHWEIQNGKVVLSELNQNNNREVSDCQKKLNLIPNLPEITSIFRLIGGSLSAQNIKHDTILWVIKQLEFPLHCQDKINKNRLVLITKMLLPKIDKQIKIKDLSDNELELSFCWNPFLIISTHRKFDLIEKINLLTLLYSFLLIQPNTFSPSSIRYPFQYTSRVRMVLRLDIIFDIIQTLFSRLISSFFNAVFSIKPSQSSQHGENTSTTQVCNQEIYEGSNSDRFPDEKEIYNLLALVRTLFELSHRAIAISVQGSDVGVGVKSAKDAGDGRFEGILNNLDIMEVDGNSDENSPTELIFSPNSMTDPSHYNSTLHLFYTQILRYFPILFNPIVYKHYSFSQTHIGYNCVPNFSNISTLFSKSVQIILLNNDNLLLPFITPLPPIYQTQPSLPEGYINHLFNDTRFTTNIIFPAILFDSLDFFSFLINNKYFHIITKSTIFDLLFGFFYLRQLYPIQPTDSNTASDNNPSIDASNNPLVSILPAHFSQKYSFSSIHATLLEHSYSLKLSSWYNLLKIALHNIDLHHRSALVEYFTLPIGNLGQISMAFQHGLLTHDYFLTSLALDCMKSDDNFVIETDNYGNNFRFLFQFPTTNYPFIVNLHTSCIINLLLSDFIAESPPLGCDFNITSTNFHDFDDNNYRHLTTYQNHFSSNRSEFLSTDDINNSLDIDVLGDLYNNPYTSWGTFEKFNLSFQNNFFAPIYKISITNPHFFVLKRQMENLSHCVAFENCDDEFIQARLHVIIDRILLRDGGVDIDRESHDNSQNNNLNNNPNNTPDILQPQPLVLHQKYNLSPSYSYHFILTIIESILNFYQAYIFHSHSKNPEKDPKTMINYHLLGDILHKFASKSQNAVFFRYLLPLLRRFFLPFCSSKDVTGQSGLIESSKCVQNILFWVGGVEMEYPKWVFCVLGLDKFDSWLNSQTPNPKKNKKELLSDVDFVIYSQLVIDFDNFD